MTTANLVGTGRNSTWEERANCYGHPDPEIFFPELTGRNRKDRERFKRRVEQALEVCVDCPVRTECRDKAHRIHVRCGIWGGEFLGVAWRERSRA